MDFKKIIEASKVPLIIVFALNLAIFLLYNVVGKTAVQQMEPLIWLASLFGILLILYIGYNGAKKFHFNYRDAATGGAVAGLLVSLPSVLAAMVELSRYPLDSFFATFFANILLVLFPTTCLIALITAFVSLLGAFIAKHTK